MGNNSDHPIIIIPFNPLNGICPVCGWKDGYRQKDNDTDVMYCPGCQNIVNIKDL